MLHDLRFALRSLRRRPGFTASVVATLALGLGANAALFSLVDAVMLRSLPYPDAERLVSLFETVSRDDATERRTLSYPDFEAVRDDVAALEAVAASAGTSFVVDGGERAERRRGERVTRQYFAVLGITPLRGGGFTGDGGGQVVIGHAFWRSSFGGAENIVGRSLRIDGEAHTVVGVMPPHFGGVRDDRELWTALEALPEATRERDNRFLDVVARRTPGADLELVNEQLATVFARLEVEFPDTHTGYSAAATTLHDELVGDLRGPVRLLLCAVGLLLLIACVNVANLLLVHRIQQRRQAAVRLALGAGPSDLVRWNVIEVLVLALASGVLGLLCATWGLSALVRLAPADLPAFAAITINRQVVAFSLVLATVVAAVLGFATALQVRRGTAPTLLRQGAATIDGPRHGVHRLLLGSEVALALVVVIGALSMLRGWHAFTHIDPGFEARSAIVQLTLPGDTASRDGEDEATRQAALQRQLLDAMASTPGSTKAALASDSPLAGGYSATVVSREGGEPRPGEPYGGAHRTYVHAVSAGYFDALGIPRLQGDGFGGTTADSPAVAIVSRALADRLWPASNPVGLRFKLGPPQAAPSALESAAGSTAGEPDWIRVIGVVDEVRHRSLVPAPERIAEDPDLYLPLAQWPRRSLSGIVRVAQGDGATLLPTLRERLEAVRADMPVYGLRTLADDLSMQTARYRFGTVLMSTFASLSLLLAALGIYAVMAYRVSEQAREIGLRMALGATRANVMRLSVRDGLHATAIGLVVGAVLTFAVRSLVAGEDLLPLGLALDPSVIGMALLALGLVALAACALPAHRASRVDPLGALRQD